MGDQKPSFKFLRSSFQVPGVSTITVLNKRLVSILDDDLLYYNGEVSFSPNYSLDCAVLSFSHHKEVEVKSLFSRLNSMSSPYITMPIACGSGVDKFRLNYFLALPKFSYTFTQFIKERKVVEKRRFTEEFIQVIRNIVHGILAIKENGFSCRSLVGKDVLISCFENTVTSKIWKIEAENVQGTPNEWVRLGHLIRAAADEELLNTAEIDDLCDKLINRGLEGLKVLKQSALLTPRQKFENILALNLYIRVNKKDSFASALKRNPEKQNAINNLLAFMHRKDINWCTEIPGWISSVPSHTDRTDRAGDQFVYWLRYILEHEDEYVPPEKVKETKKEIKKFGSQPDLEAHVRALMEILFLQVQNVAGDLELEY